MLLEFAQQEDPDGMELYRELAVYDLYLRENAKSRPAFALDEKPYHDQIVEFYQEEEKNRAYLPGYEEYHARQLQRMTHLEVFSWSVQKKAWELISMLKRGEVPETKTAILFDYQNRDRLTDNARTAVVELRPLRTQNRQPDSDRRGRRSSRRDRKGGSRLNAHTKAILDQLDAHYGREYICYLNHETRGSF